MDFTTLLTGLFTTTMYVVIIYYIVRYLKKKKAERETEKRSALQSTSKLDMSDPAFKAMIDESVMVVNDILEVGLSALTFSDNSDYEGFIITLVEKKLPEELYVDRYGIFITMSRSGDLRQCTRKYPKFYEKEWDQLQSFVRLYGNYYDPAEQSYIYHSRNTITVPKSAEGAHTIIKEQFTEQVKLRCPLADFGGVGLHTKNIYH